MKNVFVIGLVCLFIGCTQKPTTPTSQIINKDSIITLYANAEYVGSVSPTNDWRYCWSGYYDTIYTIRYGACTGYKWDTTAHPMQHQIAIGDVDNSGWIDIADLTKLITYLNCSYVSEKFSIVACDMYPDGVIDIADLTALIDYLYISGYYPSGNCTRPTYYGCGGPATEPYGHVQIGASYIYCN